MTGPGVRMPTTRGDWRLLGRTVRLVLAVPRYAALAVVASVASLTLFVVSLNAPLVLDVVLGGSLPPGNRLRIMLELYPFVGTSFGPVEGTLLVAVAGLTGVDAALAGYHLREHGLALQEGGAGALGVLLGALGAGCAACGSAVLLGLLSLFGVTTSLAFLPFDGLGFAALGLVPLTLSAFWLAEGMRGGNVAGCPVEADP